MNKEKYIQLIENHRRILEKSRDLIENIFNKIQEDIDRKPSENLPAKNTEDYEDAANIVNKLSSILLKVITKEQEIALIDLKRSDENSLTKTDLNAPITKEDIEMMEYYLERYNKQSNVTKTPSPLYRAEDQAKADAGEGWDEEVNKDYE